MALFNRPYMTFCWSATASIALSYIISQVKQDSGRKSQFLPCSAVEAWPMPLCSVHLSICISIPHVHESVKMNKPINSLS